MESDWPELKPNLPLFSHVTLDNYFYLYFLISKRNIKTTLLSYH